MTTQPAPSQRYIKEGAGWRVGWDENADRYRGLVAGADWALELEAQEFEDFCRLAAQLGETMAAMADQIVEAERLACEAETERLWLEAEGFPERYGLRLLLLQGRRAEGGWPPEVVPELLRAIAGLGGF